MPANLLRSLVRDSIQRSMDDIRRVESAMNETVLKTRELIAATHDDIAEANRLLRQR